VNELFPRSSEDWHHEEKGMSRLGVTYEEVAEVAESILQKGESPTIDKVRQSLGGTGSNTTISKYLNGWRNHYFQSKTPNAIKNNTPDVVKSAVERVWQEMSAQASAEIQAMKDAVAANAVESEEICRVASDERDAANHALETMRDSYREIAAQKEILSLDLKALQDERTLSLERYKNLEERYAELHNLTSQHLKDLSEGHQNEIRRLENNAVKMDAAHHALINAMQIQHEADRHQYMHTLDELRTEHHKKDETISKLQTLLSDQKSAAVELRVRVESLAREKDTLTCQLSQQESKWSVIHENNKKIDDIFAHLQSQSLTNFDINLSYVSLFNNYDAIINESFIKVSDVTERLSASAESIIKNYKLDEMHGT
jgi:predicted  nucleic acid-binding Zn-ribbon protein